MNAVGFTATKTPAKTLLRNVKAAAQKALMTRFELALTRVKQPPINSATVLVKRFFPDRSFGSIS
jgi:hypothetical protein